MYVRIENDIVQEIIPDFSPEFPGISIKQRYTESFISLLKHVSDDTDVEVGYQYKDGDFIPYVPVVTEEDIDIAKISKINKMSDICTRTIYAGTSVKLSDGTVEYFTLDNNDQLNLSGLAIKISMGATEIYWHENDVTKPCKIYSAKDAQIIIGTLTTFKEYNITYFRDLRIYINSLDNIDDINNIEYGFNIPEEYKSEVLKKIESQMNLV